MLAFVEPTIRNGASDDNSMDWTTVLSRVA